MITALVFALATHTLVATDDVWVYPHSYDQTGDPLLRVWGDGTSSVGSPEYSEFSYSIVRFDLSAVKEPAADLKKATLVLWLDAETTMTPAESKANPLEARLVDASLDEKRWAFVNHTRHMPVSGEASLLGKGTIPATESGKPIKLSIDLLSGKGDFRKALGGKAVAFALTSRVASGGPEGPYYRIHSRSSEEKLRPTLVLEF